MHLYLQAFSGLSQLPQGPFFGPTSAFQDFGTCICILQAFSGLSQLPQGRFFVAQKCVSGFWDMHLSGFVHVHRFVGPRGPVGANKLAIICLQPL